MPKVHIFEMSHKRPTFQIGDISLFQEKMGSIEKMYELAGVFRCGNRVLGADEVPQSLILNKKGVLIDIFGTVDGLKIVSSKFRNLLQKYDPDVHQFFEVELLFPKKEKAHGDWYVMNVHAHKKTVLKHLSGVSTTEDGKPTQFRSHLGDAVFGGAALEGAHLWREEDFNSEMFLSEALMTAIKDGGLKVFRTRTGDIQTN